MIQLTAIREDCNRYLSLDNLLIGPLAIDGQDSLEFITEFRGIGDFISEDRGIYGENDVTHHQSNGKVIYNPHLAAITSVPYDNSTYYCPDRITMQTSAIGFTSPLAGLAIDRCVRRFRIGTAWYHYGFLANTLDNMKFTLYEVTCTGTPLKATGFSVYEYTLSPLSATQVSSFRKSYTHWKLEGMLSTNWSIDVPFDTIVNYHASIPIYGTSTATSNKSTVKPYYTSLPGLSPSQVKEATDITINTILLSDFPIEPVAYGDLAMRASEKVNANKVNMIAFLRDLRHPTELIPKLKNLSSIKVLSGNYLNIIYGILPTVDDINSIVDAFHKLKPYVDFNGYETYTSGSIQNQVENGSTYSLDQRLKLAIGTNDTQLENLVNRLDSLGVLPTFENLWDLVPYSFVVDWLLDVGGLLQRIDSSMRLVRLDIKYLTMSEKRQITKDLVWTRAFPYTGSVSLVQYHRWVSDQCPAPPLSLHTTFSGFDHWLESAALLIQRRK